MNWDAIGAVAEGLGATGVIISLVYLATQIRAQNRESRIAALHDLSVSFRASISNFTNGELARIFVRANEDYDSLDSAEQLQMIALVAEYLRMFEEAYIQHTEGRLDKRTWDSMAQYLAMFMAGNCPKRIWELRGPYMDPEYQRFVNSLETSEFMFPKAGS
ncbi:MAG: hypothetical protein ACI9BW_002577 [Gammaproteobacteria bacterium]|jgi:hypothetical protein